MSSKVLLFSFLLVLLFLVAQPVSGQNSFFQVPSPWLWTCNEKKRCIREAASIASQPVRSHAACKLTCYDHSVLWPKPTGKTVLSKTLIPIKADRVKVSRVFATAEVKSMLEEATSIFLDIVRNMESNGNSSSTCSLSSRTCGAVPNSALTHQFNIDVSVTNEDIHLITTTDESYNLDVVTSGSTTTAYIVAPTFFGARHAMETISQLMGWDDLLNSIVVIKDASISDRPVFPHRGLMIDSSRSYIDMPIMKKIIDGLSYNKLNVLHWHLTDSQSFPFVSIREPLMAVYGAYSPRQIYRPQDIQELVHYAMVRGVKIIPELDAPSHIGAGWDWGPRYGLGELALCYGIEPWDKYCFEPPCGVLDPSNNNIYPILNNIYKDMSELFQSDVFHMGGDEVKSRCWNETDTVLKLMNQSGWDRTTEEGFLKLWSYYQNKSLEELDKAYGKSQDVILWTNDLTDGGRAVEYLDNQRYIIQFWDDVNKNSTKSNLVKLLEQNYSLIMSNADALYLDCGYSAWVGGGMNNWCSPYKGWQRIYDNSPRKIVESYNLNYTDHKDKFMGGEAAMWTEQVQGWAIEGKLWPRTSALAERLWSDPTTGWLEAEPRMRSQRNRMVDRGIAADSIQPQFCDQNDASCFLNN